MAMNKFINKYGTVKAYHDSFNSLFSKMRFDEWYLVNLFICGLPPDIEKGVSIYKPKTLSDAYCLAKLQESTHSFLIKSSNQPLFYSSKTDDSKEGLENNVGLRDLDVSWKEDVGSEEIELRVSGMDGSNKSVEVLDVSCEENVEDSSEIRVNSNCLMVLNNFECDQSREREFTSFSLSQPSKDTPKILNHSLEENGNPDEKTKYDFWDSTLVKMEKVSEETKTSVANSQEVGIKNIRVKNYKEGGKENADVKGKDNANVKGKEIECVDLILLDESEYFGLNVFNEFMCEDDEIKVKNSKSGDSKFLVTKDDGFVSDVDVRKLLLHKQNGSHVRKQKGFHLWGGYVDNQRYVEGWEDEDKDLNVFDYNCDVNDLSTKVSFGANEFFVNKKQGEYFDKIKRKLSDVDAMNLEGNLGHLEFDIWKWLRRTKIDDTNCKCNHGKRKVDVWRWPHRKKERKGARRAKNNDYELAEKSPKRGDKVGIELVILELLDLKREKERPLSSLVNKEGQTKVGIEMLFDGKAPSFRIANTLENYILTFETNGGLIVETKQVFDLGGKGVCNLGGTTGDKDFHKLEWETNCSVVAVILYVQSLLGMEESVTRLVLEVATA
ncbi:hypothetical protein Tco_1049395 [Tanacetum coccineum]